jgi:hypothetical protein
MDEFKRHIKGFRKGGATCPCCREAEKQKSRRLARRRLGKLLLEVWRDAQAPD